ncbi:D-amino-acid transaminase [Alkalihalobacillus pseudalcaliphilus]|uniref:D-amino-acid transaminase n=1 Tax=Alkalihalobacillus pseudalcaliphilus TaxID=79884 RepID=UPI00064DA69F|nr:D-amino-acid transaminase [Alkalihalobacillus pseudalcaliphilus]KMK76976.1 D-alanine aminotransferase [Alkalihalobacillus pseudalcaliphilus]
MEYVIDNGHIIVADQAKIDRNDRGYHFGDGIYEVIRVYNGKPFTMDMHVKRFEESAKKLDMVLTLSLSKLEELLMELVKKNALQDGIIYVQMTRGISPRNHLYSRNEKAVITGYTQEMPSKVELQQNGIDVWVTDDIRWLRCDIKTINLLGNVLAKREAADHDCHEAIQHRNGIVTEGSSSNLFLIKDRILYTHPATNLILNGITRQVVIGLAKELGYEVFEEAFPKDVIEHADEAFITSTTSEVTPIKSFQGQVEVTLEVGPITRQLQEAFEKEK